MQDWSAAGAAADVQVLLRAGALDLLEGRLHVLLLHARHT